MDVTSDLPLLPVPAEPLSFARVARHLKLTLTPHEYITLLDEYRTSGGKHYRPYSADDERDPKVSKFWMAFPEYLIARCPICEAIYTERMDTHQLSNGWLSGLEDCVYSREYQFIGCEHRVGVQGFINLNGSLPTELRYYSSNSEAPYLMPVFLPDTPTSYAVMHSLPICRLEDDQFVPRYTLFMLTYFSEDPSELRRRRWEGVKKNQDDSDFHLPVMYTWSEVAGVEEAWNLSHWVARGKLWWLDLDQADLPLISGAKQKFPYGNIPGHQRPFVYRDGKLMEW